ncbi:phytoene/squalene synthase family protein [Sinorhizobium numidicum]|uniref:Phytoene/squalene synthase family protein n=1 Tax=Sinorhizobium numidicum TaxID=680248 RepID=A0ABY8CWH9_9HYPH|nr:phytoene/squalene synthase family protein [Sinorhizobium numidicum]WEX78860.1 phytoene/squalene synthase family protein [Sinorhizobium numidicum]WEX82257.1 phytoene/squalene synthase family protein [Sinorhizobium numidicum]
MQDPDAQILAILRDTDRDRYLACLLSPAEKQPSLAALYAFYAEIGRVRDLIHEPLPGEIRLQWWRDILEKDRSTGEGHPLAEALLQCIREHRLPVAVLLNMIDARIFDLYDDPMQDRSALEGYAGETASALIQLSSLILDPESAASSAEAAGHAGVAQTIAGLLMLLPTHTRRGQVYLPAELLRATGLERESLLAGRDEEAIGRAVRAFCGLGRDHLAKARQNIGSISAKNFPAFIPVALAEPVFDRAEAAGDRTLQHSVQPPQWQRQWRMWRASRRRRF